MIHINTNLKHIKDFIADNQLQYFNNKIENTFNTIYNKSGAGNDFLGWTTLPSEMTKEFIKDIKGQAELIRKKSEVFARSSEKFLLSKVQCKPLKAVYYLK